MKKIDLQNVKANEEYTKLVAGGYICKLKMPKDISEKEYLEIEYDIADGNFKNYYANLFEKFNFWGGVLRKSYKESALPFFKGFITAVENSNAGYKFNNDEKTLAGKLVGIVLREEEYKKNDGMIATRLYADEVRSVEKIKAKDFVVKPLKKLATTQSTSDSSELVPVNPDNCPF